MQLIKKIFLFVYSFLVKIFHFGYFISALLLFISYYSSHLHPESFKLLATLSLMFPVLLLLNLIWILIFAILLQYKRLIIAIIVQLYFFPQLSDYYNISFSEKNIPAQKALSVMSFNVKLFDLYNWQNNYLTREKIFNYLKTHPADIMCFQEFYTSEDSNDFNNLQDLKKLFPDYYFHSAYFVTLRKNDHWGLLTMSKYPIIKQSVIHFNNAKNNGCIYSDIIYNNDTIRVFNLHLQSFSLFKKKKWKPNQKPDDENFIQALDTSAKGLNIIQKFYLNSQLKTQQAENILKIASNTPYPVLIVGDFNDIPNSYLMYQLSKHQFTDAFKEKGNGFGFTYHDKIYLRIDYIFHSKHFTTLDFNVDNSSETKHLSDHYPIRGYFMKVKSE